MQQLAKQLESGRNGMRNFKTYERRNYYNEEDSKTMTFADENQDPEGLTL